MTTDYLTNFQAGLKWGYEAIFQGGLFRVGRENSLAKIFPYSWTPKTPEEKEAAEFRASIFEETGITSAEFGAMSIAQRDAFSADTEKEAVSKYPEYTADMELLAETAPYLLTEKELALYGQ